MKEQPRIKIDTIAEKWETVNKTNHRTMKSFFFKVVKEDGTTFKDYKFERARKIFEREGVKIYAYTKNLFPIVLLIDWKQPREIRA